MMLHSQVGKSKSPRVLRFRLMFSKSSWISRSGGEIERIADGNSDNSFWTIFTESMESHLSSGGILSQDLRHWNCFERFRKTKAQKHWSCKIWWSNHLHVNVQRHRWEHHESLVLFSMFSSKSESIVWWIVLQSLFVSKPFQHPNFQ